ncbi:MAG: hypothetical protein K6A37_06850 [Saccharofermentans sp.]|nr:hypothetical protein [Saccharofermentans sp.]
MKDNKNVNIKELEQVTGGTDVDHGVDIRELLELRLREQMLGENIPRRSVEDLIRKLRERSGQDVPIRRLRPDFERRLPREIRELISMR